MATIVESARLIMTDASNNNNKYWHGELYDDGTVHSKWGRVGYESGSQEKTWNGVGRPFFDKKKKEKLAKGYVEQRTVANSQAKAASSHSGRSISSAALKQQAINDIGSKNSAVAKLISWLAEVNVHNILANTQNMTYDESSGTFSTPLGLVTQDGLIEARTILNDLAGLVQKRDHGHRFSQLASDLLAIIPQNVGMKRGWDQAFFGTNDLLRKQYDLLDALDASLASAATVKPTKASKTDGKRVFEVELDIVSDGRTIDHVKRKYNADKGNHWDVKDLDVKQVWTIKLPTMSTAFESHGKKFGNIMHLWHGTKASNLLSILKVGLIIPPSSAGHCTGRMFGDGLYFSDQSTKAIRYATGGWGGGGNTVRTFMFLADVAMGKTYTPSGYGMNSIPSGYDSCFAKAGRSGVQNNEMIVYKTSQANLVYLCEFSKGGR